MLLVVVKGVLTGVLGGKITTTWGRFYRSQDVFFDFFRVSFISLFPSFYVFWIFRNRRRHLFIKQQGNLCATRPPLRKVLFFQLSVKNPAR